MEISLEWNIALFHALNASRQPEPFVLGAAKLLALGTPYLIIAALALIWLFGGPARRRSIMTAGITLAAGLAANHVIAATTYMPRPFEAGVGHTFLAHAIETSFPSDHATFVWSLGFALVAAPPLRWAGLTISILGVATAWSRIFLGVHFPLDMAGSLTISLAATIVVLRISHRLESSLFPAIERLYVKVVNYVLRRPIG